VAEGFGDDGVADHPHDQTEASAMTDRLAIMHQGRIVQLGTPKDVRGNPADDLVQHFLIGGLQR
jgi:ABC-type proline/glycine betaine transport system ATPase subunit